MSLSPSAKCDALIMGFEGFRATAYLDGGGVPTIGYGTTGKDVHLGMVWTELQARQRFAQDLVRFSTAVNNLIGTHPTNQNQYDALVSFAYNVGAHALAGSTLLMLHNSGRYDAAAAQFAHWDHINGVVSKGLLNRRNAEAALYLEPVA